MSELICIVCPKGCHVRVEDDRVTGAQCARGVEYARKEATSPTRVLTSTVRLLGGAHPRLPVKTDRDIPKALIFSAVRLLDGVTLQSPVHAGDVVAANICGTDANWVATRDL